MAFRVQNLGDIASILHPKTVEVWEDRELVDIRLVLCFIAQMTVVKVISLNLFPYHQL